MMLRFCLSCCISHNVLWNGMYCILQTLIPCTTEDRSYVRTHTHIHVRSTYVHHTCTHTWSSTCCSSLCTVCESVSLMLSFAPTKQSQVGWRFRGDCAPLQAQGCVSLLGLQFRLESFRLRFVVCCLAWIVAFGLRLSWEAKKAFLGGLQKLLLWTRGVLPRTWQRRRVPCRKAMALTGCLWQQPWPVCCSPSRYLHKT